MNKKLLALFSLIIIFSIRSSLAQWAPVGTGINATVDAVAYYNNQLYVGGSFTTPQFYIQQWTGSTWTFLGSGLTGGLDVYALAVYKTDLYAGGGFATAGGNSANKIAKWNGSLWSAVSGGANSFVRALAPSSDGQFLYVGGTFSAAGGLAGTKHIARWNGLAWAALDTGITGTDVYALAEFNNEIYVGGTFTSAGHTAVNNIAKWNPLTLSWAAVGSGITGTGTVTVKGLAVYNGALYATGNFTTAGGVPASDIAKWNGTTWSALGTGLTGGFGLALTDFNGLLYVGGYFTQAGGVSGTAYLARWNGSVWSAAITPAFNGDVDAFTVVPGAQPVLYAGGTFTQSGSTNYSRVAKYTSLVGIEEETLSAGSIRIYPNPAKDKLTIRFSEDLKLQSAEFSVYDILGNKILQRNITQQMTIDVSSFSAGVYFVKVIAGNKTYTTKLIIEPELR
jgi:hypothetical protein